MPSGSVMRAVMVTGWPVAGLTGKWATCRMAGGAAPVVTVLRAPGVGAALRQLAPRLLFRPSLIRCSEAAGVPPTVGHGNPASYSTWSMTSMV